jgi:hypothetical protein
MKLLSFLKRSLTAAKKPKAETAAGPKYVFCETTAAYVWHVRKLSEQGIKLGGGADTKTLCGLRPSWDLKAPVAAYAHIVRDGQGNGICHKCLQEYRKIR